MQPRMKTKLNALLKYCKTKLKPKIKTPKTITNNIHKAQTYQTNLGIKCPI